MQGARPLIATGAPLVVSWSPKSACTQVLQWLLFQEGLLGAAQYFSRWPHDFRGRVYYHSASYHAAAQKIAKSDAAGYVLLRVTRDPTARFVSIFRHALLRPVMRTEINTFVGRDIGSEGMSIAEFAGFLAGKNLLPPSPLDQHLCAQCCPVWEMGFDRVITLNIDTHDLFAGLNAVAADLGLLQTPFDSLPAFARIANAHHAKNVSTTEANLLNKRLTAAQDNQFPLSALQANPEVQSLATQLYQLDVGRVETTDSAAQLTFDLRS